KVSVRSGASAAIKKVRQAGLPAADFLTSFGDRRWRCAVHDEEEAIEPSANAQNIVITAKINGTSSGCSTTHPKALGPDFFDPCITRTAPSGVLCRSQCATEGRSRRKDRRAVERLVELLAWAKMKLDRAVGARDAAAAEGRKSMEWLREEVAKWPGVAVRLDS